MSRTITVNGSLNSLFLRMNVGVMQFAVGATTPGLWTSILNSEWPVTIINSASASSTILNVLFTQNLSFTDSYGSNSGYFIMGSSYITFNGQTYTITINSNIFNYPGLIQNGTSITNGRANIVVKNISTDTTGAFSNNLTTDAGWICQAYFGRGASANSIETCINNYPFGQSGADGTGGIAGAYAGSCGISPAFTAGSITFTNCTNNAQLRNNTFSGGIAGRYAGYGGGAVGRVGSVTFISCTNSGTISGIGGGGGITSSYAGSNYGSATITNCTSNAFSSGPRDGGMIVGPYAGANYGNVSITNFITINSSGTTFSDSGGLVGKNAADNYGVLTISGCINNMTEIAGAYAGGIVGANAGNNYGSVTITNCNNTGYIAGSAIEGGGIVGANAGSNNGSVTITNCSTTDAGLQGPFSGGIVGAYAGRNNGSVIITTCMCAGFTIQGGSNGGIVGAYAGFTNGSVTITNCSNSMRIGADFCGGIIGAYAGNTGGSITITNCFNTGEVSNPNCGGIAGYAFANNTNSICRITGCYNTRNITNGDGTSGGIVGGVVGYSNNPGYTASVDISNCYSLGSVGNIKNGGICGGNDALLTYANKANISITNSYVFNTSVVVAPSLTSTYINLTTNNIYAAGNTWSDTTANTFLTGDPSGIGIANGQAGAWTSVSANTPYIISSYFSLTNNKIPIQIYSPEVLASPINCSSAPGLYQPGIYSIAATNQAGSGVFTTNVYVIGGTSPIYTAYGYTTYTLINLNGGSGRKTTVTINPTTGVLSFILPYPCFLEGTKILCFENNEEVYRPVESLRKGDLVKTIYNGYLPIHKIGTSPMYNPNNDDRISDRLYKCSKENYPALFEDLYITGCHSILVPRLTYEQGLITMASLGKLYVTDKHCRLMAWVDEKSEPYTRGGIYNIYHIALENKDYYMNYGIYANGLLVETCSKRYLTELSNMQILGEEDSSVIEDVSSEENVFHHMPRLVDIC